MEHHGPFSPDDPDWHCQAQLETEMTGASPPNIAKLVEAVLTSALYPAPFGRHTTYF
jgi:hypothetical protein